MKKRLKSMMTLKKLCGIALACCTSISLIGCKSEENPNERISCHFEFINPETGEKIERKGTSILNYETVYLTYKDEPQTISYYLCQNESHKKIETKNVLYSVEIVYTYTAPLTGKKTWNLPYMKDSGEYNFVVKDMDYDRTKYFITEPNIIIYIQ